MTHAGWVSNRLEKYHHFTKGNGRSQSPARKMPSRKMEQQNWKRNPGKPRSARPRTPHYNVLMLLNRDGPKSPLRLMCSSRILAGNNQQPPAGRVWRESSGRLPVFGQVVWPATIAECSILENRKQLATG